MKKILGLALVGFSLSQSVQASGLDLSLAFGSRLVGLGGNQIGVVDGPYSPFFNPAGLMGIENGAFAVNSANLLMQYDAPIGAANQQKKSEWNWGPLFYIGGGYRLTDRVVFGLGIYPTALQGGKFKGVDFGGEIDEKEVGNQLMRIEFSPSIAVKLFEHVSLGASWRSGYTRFENKGGVFGAVNTYQDVTLSGWDAKGFKVGTRLHEFHGFSAGLTYRFKTTTTLEGGGTRYIDQTAVAGPLVEQDLAGSKLKINIPAQLQVGAAYEILKDRALVAFTYEFTKNDVIDDLEIRHANDTTTLPLRYQDGHTFHLGGEYAFHLSNERRLRTQLGLAVDMRTSNKEYPAPAIPPADHYIGYAVGAQYEWSNHIVGLAANYGQYSDRPSTIKSNDFLPDTLPAGSTAVFDGRYGLKVIYLVADYQFHF